MASVPAVSLLSDSLLLIGNVMESCYSGFCFTGQQRNKTILVYGLIFQSVKYIFLSKSCFLLNAAIMLSPP